jgi:hypothetical protein
MTPELPPFPDGADDAARADWWHRWAEIGRGAARLDPEGALYTPAYRGDHVLHEAPPEGGEPA